MFPRTGLSERCDVMTIDTCCTHERQSIHSLSSGFRSHHVTVTRLAPFLMGFKQAAILGPVSFFLGQLSIEGRTSLSAHEIKD